jgi:hypothetical protein
MFGFLRQFFEFFLPSTSSGNNDQTVYLATAPEPVAKMWQDILRREGIIAMVKLETGAVGQPYIPAFAPVYQLHVLESQSDQAKAVLEPYVKGETPSPKRRSGSGARQRRSRKR